MPPESGVNREFQINPGRADQFVDTALRMEEAGADMLLLEPAQFTADVLATLRRQTHAPLFPFSVSGEYTSMTRVEPETGRRDVRLLVELFTMLKRQGERQYHVRGTRYRSSAHLAARAARTASRIECAPWSMSIAARAAPSFSGSTDGPISVSEICSYRPAN